MFGTAPNWAQPIAIEKYVLALEVPERGRGGACRILCD